MQWGPAARKLGPRSSDGLTNCCDFGFDTLAMPAKLHMQMCDNAGGRVDMSGVVVCSAPDNLVRAGQFARNTLRGADLRTFEDLLREIPAEPILVYFTHPDFDHVKGLLEILRPKPVDIVIYYATRPAPEQAAKLGRLIGEIRPQHTAIVFEAKAAVECILRAPHHGSGTSLSKASNRVRVLREGLGLTQTELAQALGTSLRTVQNWERDDRTAKGHRLRDLEELRSALEEVVPDQDLRHWLRAKNKALGGRQPFELIVEGKARDILSEFRRLQAGEPI